MFLEVSPLQCRMGPEERKWNQKRRKVMLIINSCGRKVDVYMCSSTVPTVCILGEPENSSCIEILDSKVKYSLSLKKKKNKNCCCWGMAAWSLWVLSVCPAEHRAGCNGGIGLQTRWSALGFPGMCTRLTALFFCCLLQRLCFLRCCWFWADGPVGLQICGIRKQQSRRHQTRGTCVCSEVRKIKT